MTNTNSINMISPLIYYSYNILINHNILSFSLNYLVKLLWRRQPQRTMHNRVKYIPNIVTGLDTNPTVSHLDKSSNYISHMTSESDQQSQLLYFAVNSDQLVLQIRDRIILCSGYHADNAYCPAFVPRFPICLTQNLIEHINFILTGPST